LYAGLLGILLCVVYERSETLSAPVILHMAANTAALIMMYLPASTWISGHLLIKLLVMVVELLALAFCVYCFCLNTKTRKDEKGIEE
jgi:membrane protease YdiL (CAAX protease family)